MAIYHFAVKNISRSDGRSAVAAAAYRSGECLQDKRQGKVQDYTKKSGIELAKLYSPMPLPEGLHSREAIWNAVEERETRRNSQLAREFEIAFPCELDQTQRQAMLDELCQAIVSRHAVIVDAAIHAPHVEAGSDSRNYHAHIMLTTRRLEQDGTLGEKTREFNDSGREQVEYWREFFAGLANRYLEQAGSKARVSHKSYADQKLILAPTQHEGARVTQLRRMGIDTEISLSNDTIRRHNASLIAGRIEMRSLRSEITASQELLAKLEQDGQAIEAEIALETPVMPLAPPDRANPPASPEASLTPQSGGTAAPSPSPADDLASRAERAREFAAQVDHMIHRIAAQILQERIAAEQAQQAQRIASMEQLKQTKPRFTGKDKWESDMRELQRAYSRGKEHLEELRSGRYLPTVEARQRLEQQRPDLKAHYERAMQVISQEAAAKYAEGMAQAIRSASRQDKGR